MADNTTRIPLLEEIKPNSGILGQLAVKREELITQRKSPEEINEATTAINQFITIKKIIDKNKSGTLDSSEISVLSYAYNQFSAGPTTAPLIDAARDSIAQQLQNAKDINSTELTLTEPLFGLKTSPQMMSRFVEMMQLTSRSSAPAPSVAAPPEQLFISDPTKRAERFTEAFSRSTGMTATTVQSKDSLQIILSPQNQTTSAPATNNEASSIITNALQPWWNSWQKASSVPSDAVSYSVGSDKGSIAKKNQIIISLPNSNDAKTEETILRFLKHPEMAKQLHSAVTRAIRIAPPEVEIAPANAKPNPATPKTLAEALDLLDKTGDGNGVVSIGEYNNGRNSITAFNLQRLANDLSDITQGNPDEIKAAKTAYLNRLIKNTEGYSQTLAFSGHSVVRLEGTDIKTELAAAQAILEDYNQEASKLLNGLGQLKPPTTLPGAPNNTDTKSK